MAVRDSKASLRGQSDFSVGVARNKTCEPRKNASQRRSVLRLYAWFLPFGIHLSRNCYKFHRPVDILVQHQRFTEDANDKWFKFNILRNCNTPSIGPL